MPRTSLVTCIHHRGSAASLRACTGPHAQTSLAFASRPPSSAAVAERGVAPVEGRAQGSREREGGDGEGGREGDRGREEGGGRGREGER